MLPRVPKPATDLGRTCLFMLWCVLWIALLFGLVAAVSLSLGCEPNEAAAGNCMLGSVNLMTPLSVLGIAAGFGAFIAAPLMLAISAISGLICLVRRRW